MPHLEPTYLRYIYDGLIKGSIHPENAAELPEGLIGLYEEAFDEKQPVHLRQQLLERFAIWALLKKEVSAQFIVEVLKQPEEEIQEFITKYSAWFNSPESGKYQLYHERLKVYLLQKLSEGEVHVLHEKLISRLEQAIEEQKADEFEWYGLEFYAPHLCVAAKAQFESGQNKLIDLAQNESFKTRQYMMSASFEWTYTSLDQIKAHFFSINDLDTALQIEILFAQVYHKEKNSFSELLTFIEKENLDIFIKRYQALKGESKAEIENFFYLSILVLTKICEHTFSSENSKNQFLLSAAKVLDDSIPNDPELFDWDKIISAQHVIGIIENLARIDLDKILLSRTKLKIDDWLAEEEKKQQALLEKNQAKNDEAAQVQNENLPPQDFDKIRGRRKRVEAQIEFLKSLRENGEMERAIELFISLKSQIQTIPNPIFKKTLRKPDGNGGVGFYKSRDALFFYGRVINNIQLESFDISHAFKHLHFFRELNPKDYKEESIHFFCNYYLDVLQHKNDDEIIINKQLILNYLSDLLDKEIPLNQNLDTHTYQSVICCLISIDEYEIALDTVKSLNFDIDSSDIIFSDIAWRDSLYAVVSIKFLKKGQYNHVLNMISFVSLPKYKEIIKKSISEFYISIGDFKKAVYHAKDLSNDKNHFLKLLSEQMENSDINKLLTEWLNFQEKKNYSMGILKLIPIKKSSLHNVINIIQAEAENFWNSTYFLVGLNSRNIYSQDEFLNYLKDSVYNISILGDRIVYSVNMAQLLVVNKYTSGLSFILDEIYKYRKNKTINNGLWGYKDLVKDIELKILHSIDFYEPYNYRLKLKVLRLTYNLTVYQLINNVSYFESFIKFLPKFFIYFFRNLLLSINVLFLPGLASKLNHKKRMKLLNHYFDNGSYKEVLDILTKNQDKYLTSIEDGSAFFDRIFSGVRTDKVNAQFSQISGYPQLKLDAETRRQLLNEYLSFPKEIPRKDLYLENLKALSDPTSITVESLIKSSSIYHFNKSFRFLLLYQYAVQTLLSTGQAEQFDKMMNLDVYKKIYNFSIE